MTMPKIRSLRVRAARVPMPEPHVTAAGTIAESPLVFTEIALDDGTVGRSIVFTYIVPALRPTADLIRNLEPLIVGQPGAPVDVDALLSKRFRLVGPQGLMGMAKAGIDMALWDGVARAQGISLARALGATERPVTPYGAVGYEGVAGSARTAEKWAKRGFKGVKAKIGYPTVAEDVAVIRAMREAVGPGVAIMVDYNQSLAPIEAVQRLRVLDGEGLTWVEEPTLAHDYAGHAQVARAAATPIQTGENWWGVLDMQHALDAGASDYAMPDVMKIGGVTSFMRAAALAHARNVPVSSHLWPEVSAHLLAATPTAHWLEHADWWNAVLLEPLRVEQGLTRIDGVIGSGIDWNEAVLEKLPA